MKYTKAQFGFELKKKIMKKCSVDEIAKWAFKIYSDSELSCENGLDDILMKLVCMEEGPEFFLTEEELNVLTDELIKNGVIINILGEVCWGFHIDDFEKRIGVKEDVAEDLLNRILQAEKSGILEIHISDSELQIIKNALAEVEKVIEEWEFETRLGITLEEIKNLTIFRTI